MSQEQAQELVTQYNNLKASRSTWDSTFNDLNNYFLPRVVTPNTTHSAGQTLNDQLLNSVGVQANVDLAATLYSTMTPVGSRWFMMQAGHPDDRERPVIREYFEEASRVMLREIHDFKSHFASASDELYNQLPAMGTAGIFVTEHPSDKGLHFETYGVTELTISEGPHRQIDTTFRRFLMSARQILMRWPETASKEVRELAQGDTADTVDLVVLHVIRPRTHPKMGDDSSKGKPIESTYLEMVGPSILHESGYDEMPIAVPRYSTQPGEIYGRGPGIRVLPEVKMLQKMESTILRASEKVVDPPLQYPSPRGMNAMALNINPGGLNPYDPTFGGIIQPLQTGGNIPLGLDMVKLREQVVETAFHVDRFLSIPPQGTPITAEEVITRQEERFRSLGPIAGRLQEELLLPVLTRVFGILRRQGLIPPLPAGLKRGLEFKFISPIAQSQDFADIFALQRTIQILLPLAQADPSYLLALKPAEVASGVGTRLGVPTKWMRETEEIEAMVKQAQDAAKAQQLAETAQVGTQAVSNLQQ